VNTIQIIIATLILAALGAPIVAPTVVQSHLFSVEQQQMLLAAVCGYLILQPLVRRAPKQAASQPDPTIQLREKNVALADRVRGLEGELAAVSGELREGRERGEELSRALAEAQARLAAAPARSPAQPAAQSIAEALQLVSLLQQRGRFVDFVMQDIAPISNEQVGAVARFVHQGCRSVFQEIFDIQPVRSEDEGASVHLASAPDPEKVRLQGKTPSYPTEGSIIHRGWLTTKVSLPVVTGERTPPYVIAPADVELR
jgi:hypothetical protein